MRNSFINNLWLMTGLLVLSICITSCMTAKKKNAQAQNKPLVETYWMLTHVKGEPIPKSVTPTIVFGTDGRYSGNLGCNEYYGTYQCRKDKIKMSYGAATKRLCEHIKIEKLFMQNLHSDFTRYEIKNETLYLMDANGEVLRFMAGVKQN